MFLSRPPADFSRQTRTSQSPPRTRTIAMWVLAILSWGALHADEPATDAGGTNYGLTGVLTCFDTREPALQAAVSLRNGTNLVAQCLTGADGAFSFQDLAPGPRVLEIKCVGYKEARLPVGIPAEGALRVVLAPVDSVELGEVVVTGEKEDATHSKTTLSKDLRTKSTSGDPLSILGRLPGVAVPNLVSVGGGPGGGGRGPGGGGPPSGGTPPTGNPPSGNPPSGTPPSGGPSLGGRGADLASIQGSAEADGITVRGGKGRENAAYLSGMLIPFPYHAFIAESVFLDPLVDDLTLYKGVVPARYGQCLSSLLDLSMVEPAAGFHGQADLGLLRSSLVLSGASADGKWSALGGLRRTQYDLIAPLFFTIPSNVDFTIPYYLDSQGAVRYQGTRDRVDLVWSFSGEPGKVVNSTNTNTGSERTNVSDLWRASAMLGWNHAFSPALSLSQTLDFGLSLKERRDETPFSRSVSLAQEQSFRYKGLVSASPSSNTAFRAGAEILWYPTLRATNDSTRIFTNATTLLEVTNHESSGSYLGSLAIGSLFVEQEALLGNAFHWNVGLRAGWVDFLKKPFFDPRLSLEWLLPKKAKLYASIGQLSMFPTDPTLLAALDTNRALIDIPAVGHAALGVDLSLPGSFSLNVEGYAKGYFNALALESNALTIYRSGTSEKQVFGGEVLLMRAADRLPVYGWIGFSSYFMRERRAEGDDTSTLGALQTARAPVGTWYASDSVPYQLTLDVMVDFIPGLTLTGEFSWASGSAYTPVTNASMLVSGPMTNYVPLYGEYDSARYPDQTQVNLKLQYRRPLKRGAFSAFLQVMNLLNTRPITSYTYSRDYSTKTGVQSAIGIYPNFGVSWEW